MLHVQAYDGNTAATAEFLMAMRLNHLADPRSSKNALADSLGIDSSKLLSTNHCLELLAYLPRLLKDRNNGNSRPRLGRKMKSWRHEALDNQEPSHATSVLGATIMAAGLYREGKGGALLHSTSSPNEVKMSPLREILLQQEAIKRAEMHAHKFASRTALMAKEIAEARGHSKSVKLHARAVEQHATAALAARQYSSFAAFGANNSLILNIFKLDLHGLHVREALDVLSHYLHSLKALGHPGGILLHVITGIGRHSPDGAKLQPAVLDRLSNSSHLFDIDETNPGLVKVFIEAPTPFQEPK